MIFRVLRYSLHLAAEGATDTARPILALFAEDQAKIEALDRSAGTLLRLHDLLKAARYSRSPLTGRSYTSPVPPSAAPWRTS